MVNLDDRHLLFIEPTEVASKAPVFDEYTERMQRALDKAIKGKTYRGVHTCRCSRKSTNYDLFVSCESGIVLFKELDNHTGWRRVFDDSTRPNKKQNFKTNSLAVHYLAYHRNEVPETELAKVLRLCCD